MGPAREGVILLALLACRGAAVTPVQVAPPPSPVPWWQQPPIAIAPGEVAGCRVDARDHQLALSIDGTAAGVFLPDIVGATGDAVLGASRGSAHIVIGAVELLAPLAVEGSAFRLRERPPTLAGIVDIDEGWRFRIVARDGATFTVEPEPLIGLTWTATPRLQVACDQLTTAEWPPLHWPATQARLYPAAARIALRGAAGGPVVAHLVPGDRDPRATEIGRAGGAVQVLAHVVGGRVIAWTDAAAWSATPAPPGGDRERGGGVVGAAPGPAFACAPGTPLYILVADRLHAIGNLSRSTTAPRDSHDWRFAGGRIVVTAAAAQPAASWLVLEEQFSVTNAYGHGEPRGPFVVPRDRCERQP